MTVENKRATLSQLAADCVLGSHNSNLVARLDETVIRKAGLKVAVGSIAQAGRAYDGTYHVQFMYDGDSFSSRWPSWAYEVARDALLQNRKVRLIYDDAPFGANLIQVMLVADTDDLL